MGIECDYLEGIDDFCNVNEELVSHSCVIDYHSKLKDAIAQFWTKQEKWPNKSEEETDFLTKHFPCYDLKCKE
jgi:hypothetical protein